MKRAIASPRPPSEALLDEVQAAFQRRTSRPYTRDDAREAVHNLGRFFEVLERWAREDAAKGLGPLAGRLGDTTPPELEAKSCPKSPR